MLICCYPNRECGRTPIVRSLRGAPHFLYARLLVFYRHSQSIFSVYTKSQGLILATFCIKRCLAIASDSSLASI